MSLTVRDGDGLLLLEVLQRYPLVDPAWPVSDGYLRARVLVQNVVEIKSNSPSLVMHVIAHMS